MSTSLSARNQNGVKVSVSCACSCHRGVRASVVEICFFFLYRLLLVLPKICSVRKVKEEMCSILNGTLDPDSVIVALVKENHIDRILVSLRKPCL